MSGSRVFLGRISRQFIYAHASEYSSIPEVSQDPGSSDVSYHFRVALILLSITVIWGCSLPPPQLPTCELAPRRFAVSTPLCFGRVAPRRKAAWQGAAATPWLSIEQHEGSLNPRKPQRNKQPENCTTSKPGGMTSSVACSKCCAASGKPDDRCESWAWRYNQTGR